MLQTPKPSFLDLHLSFSSGIVSFKIYDKRDDFNFDVVCFRFWMVTMPVEPLIECTFHNLLCLLTECVVV